MLRPLAVIVITLSALFVAPVSLSAQDQEPPLSELLPQLYFDVTLEEALVLYDIFGFDPRENPFLDLALDTAFRDWFELSLSIIRLAGNQLSSFPLGSASGGFTWDVDTASATFTRASNSFGPVFAERPLTVGRRRLNLGANYQRVTFDHLEGRSLRGGEIVSHFGGNIFRDFTILFADSLDLRVSTDTLNAFATFGLTDRLDVGVAVPIHRVSMSAAVTTRIGTTLTGIDEEPLLVTQDSGTASGIGDVVIRAKYNFLKRKTVGIAESIDVRLPTGDELDLLGVAGPQVKLTFIASAVAGKLSPHLNLGTRFRARALPPKIPSTFVLAPPEEVNYAVGADWALSLRTTVAFDAVGRTLRKAGTATWGPSQQFGPEFPQFGFNPGEDLHLLLGSVGLKLNPFGNMLITTNVLFPLTKNGLTDNLTWMAGVDYSF